MTEAQLLAYWNGTFDPGQKTKDVLVGRYSAEKRERWMARWKTLIKRLWPTH